MFVIYAIYRIARTYPIKSVNKKKKWSFLSWKQKHCFYNIIVHFVVRGLKLYLIMTRSKNTNFPLFQNDLLMSIRETVTFENNNFPSEFVDFRHFVFS